METTSKKTESQNNEQLTFRVRIPGRLLEKIEWLVAQPELGFSNPEHLIAAALWSFTAFKKDVLRKMRAEAAE